MVFLETSTGESWQRNRAPLASVLRIGLTTAIWGLRYYPTTALLLGLALFTGICTVLPLASLFGRSGDWFGFRAGIHPIRGGDLGLPWLMGSSSPSVAQQEAVSSLGTFLLLTLAGSVLVAVVTILSLGAARSAERRAERLIQRAVGASRPILLAAALAEMIAIAAIPMLLGSVIGVGASRAVAASWPGHPVTGAGVGILATLLVPVVFIAVLLGPAIIYPRRIMEVELHEALPTIPVIIQIAICFIALSTGALLSGRAKELLTITSNGPGSGTVVSISMGSGTARERSAQFRRLLYGLKAAGIQSVSLTSPGALTGLGYVALVLTECGLCRENGLSLSVRIKPATHKFVSPDTFQLMGLPVLAGRGITPTDDWDAPRVAVVSRSLAGREFQDGNPIGRRIHTGDDNGEGSTVVGIVPDQLPIGLGGTLQPRYGVYVSVFQHPPKTVDLLIRDPVDHQGLSKTLEVAIGRGSGHYTMSSEQAVRQADTAPVLWFGRRFELQGWAMVGLSLLGMFAFMRLWVKSLTGEIAIRRSLGARRSQILRWVVWRAVGVATKGIVAGVWFGFAIWSTLPAVVTGVQTWNLYSFLPYAVLIVGVVLYGVLWPAWHLSREFPAHLMQSGGR